MVVGADIEAAMVVVVEPLDEFVGCCLALAAQAGVEVGNDRRKAEKAFRGAEAPRPPCRHLGKNPGTGYYCVSLEEFQRSRRLHLGRNHAQQVILNPDYIYSHDLSLLDYELQ